MLNNNDINKPQLKYEPTIIRIDDKNYVSISEYSKRGNSFYDVIFNNNGKEVFIGRYNKILDNVKVMYNNGKILVYSDIKNNLIIKVYSLYDILDDTHYSLSEVEALQLFNPDLDTSFLKNKDRSVVRTDVEKRHRLIKK